MLRTLPAESVHCVVTSPPYWGLRDYGVAGQLGLEPTLGEHIEAMVAVFREVRRVLRADGTCWLNYGDCYATAPNGRSAADTKAAGNDDRTFRDKPFSTVGPIYAQDRPSTVTRGFNSGSKQNAQPPSGRIMAGGTLKPKDLCMIPNRLAIALQDDGWWVRSEIVWHKPNPMPESITDRPAVAHEKLWLLSKSARYYYDAEAVRTPATSNGKYKMPDGWDTGPGAHGSFHRQGREKGRKSDKQRGHGRRHAGFNDRWDAMPVAEQRANGANLRNVWTIPTRGYRQAHFATFPPGLVEPCLKAGCPAMVCGNCGAPILMTVTREFVPQADVSPGKVERRADQHDASSRWPGTPRGSIKSTVNGLKPTCKCGEASVPGTVLDPFAGAGTVGLVADRLQRSAILIELNPEYCEMARARIAGDQGMFGRVVMEQG